MADLMLVATEDEQMQARIERIACLENKAEQLLKAPKPDIKAITELAIEMREFGLKKASRRLLDAVGA